MKNAQFTVDEFLAVLRRRKTALLLPAILVILISGLGAFLLPRQYESSTTILVQDNGVLNPLVDYRTAVALESDDKLGDFNEIILSTPTIESLMDSLGLKEYMKSPALKAMMVKRITKNIKTSKEGAHSFTISYFDTVPSQAQKAVRVLSELFIQTRLAVENSKNDFAVNFFQKKIVELRDKFDKTQKKLVDALQRHINQLPEDDKTLYANISGYTDQIQTLEQTMRNYRDALVILEAAANTKNDQHIDLTKLYLIPLLDVPYSKELQTAVTKYNELSQQYTERFPDVQSARSSVIQLVGLVENAIRSEQARTQSKILSLEERRNKAITSVQMAAVAQSQDRDLQSNFNIYEELYNEMKVKLEQAQTNRDLGANSSREFVVIDPPQLPVKPAKPNKALIIGGGLGLGAFLGLLSAGLAEIFDTRIRTPQDVEIFDKPIIAYLPAPGSDDDR